MEESMERGMVGRHGDAGVNDNGRLLLQLCVMNTFFQHRDLQKYTWFRDSFVQRSPVMSGVTFFRLTPLLLFI